MCQPVKTLAELSDDSLRTLRRADIVHGAKTLSCGRRRAQFHRVLEGRAGGRVVSAAPRPRAGVAGQFTDARDAAHAAIFSHPTRITEAVDELGWGSDEEEFKYCTVDTRDAGGQKNRHEKFSGA